jgi:hypothetical protein
VRLVYQVEDDRLIVMVLAVDRREDSAVYMSAVTRLVKKVVQPAKALKAIEPMASVTRRGGGPAKKGEEVSGGAASGKA